MPTLHGFVIRYTLVQYTTSRKTEINPRQLSYWICRG